jgi:NAD(P)-dependent dehydrogenase (short-subunit alcohol dehydrogenase family)
MTSKVAFVTGASRGIGAEAAVALARLGYTVAMTARTLRDGDVHDHAGSTGPLAGSLAGTLRAIERIGGKALCLQADILDTASVVAAAQSTIERHGRIDLLLNNAVYQGQGNQEPVLDLAEHDVLAIYRGNVLTPLALVQAVLPGMLERGCGLVVNMVSYTAFNDPPAPASKGGWGFAYPSSKAALARMAGALRAEHAGRGLRAYNLEPGTVVTELMRAAGMDVEVLKRFKPCTPAAIAAVVAWLAEHEPLPEWESNGILRGPIMAKTLGLLASPALIGG